MRILVLGAGATGGYFGGRLAEAGADVTFLVREARAARLATEGLRIESPEGDFAGPVATVTADTLAGAFDLVVLSCKAYDLDAAIAAVTPAVGADTVVMPLLNGLNHYAALDAAFGAPRVLGGLCHIGATLKQDGTVLHTGTAHAVTFGERGGGTSSRVEAIAAAFAPARCVSHASVDVAQDLWEKFSLLAALAAATCTMRAPVGAIMATRDGEAILRGLYGECQAVAAAHDRPLRDTAIGNALSILTKRGSPFTASMLRDMENGFRVEVEHVLGDMLRRAEAKGVAAPLLRLAYCHGQSYEARRAMA